MKILISAVLGLFLMGIATPSYAHHKPGHNPVPRGPKGDKGDKGPKGDRGSKGDPGKDGLNGSPGQDGKNGKDADMAQVKANTDITLDNQNRIDELEETKWLLDVEFLLADSKHLAVAFYNSYNWRHRKNNSIGLKFIVKLGETYEERKRKELEHKLTKLLYRTQQLQLIVVEEE